ncbi:MAG: hypothetical protein WDM77_14855 [Steroidobacteraceae bacterium]
MRQHGFDRKARGGPRRLASQGRQTVSPYATGKRQDARVCDHHSTISTFKGDYRQQAFLEFRAEEIGFECE